MHAKMKQQVKNIFKQQPVSIFNYGVYKKDFESLYQYELLRSEAISLLIAIVKLKYKDIFEENSSKEDDNQQDSVFRLKPCKIIDPSVTYMLLFMGEQQYILESMEGQNLFSYRYLLIPCNTQTQEGGKGSHWFLIIYDTVENCMYTMDSVYECIHANAKTIGKRLVEMRRIFKVQQKMEKIIKESKMGSQDEEQILNNYHNEFQIKWLKNVIKQNNSYDCGIFVVGNIERILQQLSHKKQYIEHKEDQESSCLNLDEYKINVEQIKADPQQFKDLRLKYFAKAFELLKQTVLGNKA